MSTDLEAKKKAAGGEPGLRERFDLGMTLALMFPDLVEQCYQYNYK